MVLFGKTKKVDATQKRLPFAERPLPNQEGERKKQRRELQTDEFLSQVTESSRVGWYDGQQTSKNDHSYHSKRDESRSKSAPKGTLEALFGARAKQKSKEKQGELHKWAHHAVEKGTVARSAKGTTSERERVNKENKPHSSSDFHLDLIRRASDATDHPAKVTTEHVSEENLGANDVLNRIEQNLGDSGVGNEPQNQHGITPKESNSTAEQGGNASLFGGSHLVLDVRVEERSRTDPVKVLETIDQDDGEERQFVLVSSWFETPVNVGDTVALYCRYPLEGAKQMTIDEDSGLVILHPCLLVSATAVGGSYGCLRREVLNTRYSSDGGNKATVTGSILHDLFQEILCKTFQGVEDEISIAQVLKRHTEKLYEVGYGEAEVIPQLERALPEFQHFIQALCKGFEVGVEGMGMKGMPQRGVKIDNVVDIEDMYWTPKYGLKGQLDAVVGASTSEGRSRVPLELKTGRKRNTVEHGAQVVCYALLLSEKLGLRPGFGLIHYTDPGDGCQRKGPETKALAPSVKEISAVLQRRNELAAALKHEQSLPPIDQDEKMCEKCSQLPACSVLHRAHGEPPAGHPLQRDLSSGLTEKHLAFLREWDSLIAHESNQASSSANPSLQVKEVKAKGGACIANLNLLSEQVGSGDYVYAFEPGEGGAHKAGRVSQSDRAVLSAKLKGGRNVIVASGEVDSVGEDGSITMRLRKRMSNDSLLGFSLWEAAWRVDKDSSAGLFGRTRGALVNLFADANRQRQRELIVDLLPPQFANEGAVDSLSIQTFALNREQEDAVRSIVRAKDYSLVLGLPGSGKTSTLVASVVALVARGNRVLVSAHTHSAVDNLLARLIDHGNDVLRIGDPKRVSPKVESHTLGVGKKAYGSVDDLAQVVDSAPCVGCTCSGVHHSALSRRHFDVCVMDEASQVTLPAALRPLALADRFVLAGDHAQLPPLVVSEVARQGGLGTSLFERLAEAHKGAVSELTLQYRMCDSIMRLSNDITYEGRLQAGSPSVSGASMVVNLKGTEPHFVGDALCETKGLVVVDTSAAQSDDVHVAGTLLEHIHLGGVPTSQAIAISPYNSGVEALRKWLATRGLPNDNVLTVDRSQGLDKRCVVLCVGEIGPQNILADSRRLNVAVTRAREKLLIVADLSALRECNRFESTSTLWRLFSAASRQGWTVHAKGGE